jgi:hypothetical protein
LNSRTSHRRLAAKRSAEIAEASLQEIKHTNDLTNAPYVVVYIDVELGREWMYLVVANVGKMVASKIRLSFDPPLQSSHQNVNLADIPMIKDGVGSLVPGEKRVTFLDGFHSYFKEKTLPMKYVVKVSYFGGLHSDERHNEEILDIQAFEGLIYTQSKGLPELVRHVEKLTEYQSGSKKQLEKIAETLESGLWLRNSDLIVENPQFSTKSLKLMMLAKLNEISLIWPYDRDSEDKTKPIRLGLQFKCNLLSSQLIKLLSIMTDTISEDVRNQIKAVTDKLSELANWEFYMDGGQSFDKFYAFGDGMASDVNQIIKALEVLNSKSHTE